MIRDTPSEIYNYALPFSPSLSWVHMCYGAKSLQEVEVVKGLPERWGECLRTVSFDHKPQVLTCWKDLIAVGLDSGGIIIVDAITGIRTSFLSGHTCPVGTLAFSPDGTLLVSGSDDKTITLWDVQTGGLETVYSGHTGRVRSVSISPDHSMIASGSDDKTIRLWDTWTGVCFCVIDRHTAAVNSVAFSTHATRCLLSASEDHTVRRWAIEPQIGSKIGRRHNGNHLALSSRGIFVSWGRGVAKVRNSDSGAVIAKLVVPNEPLRHCCISPNGKFVAGTVHNTIFVWAFNNDPSVWTVDDLPPVIHAHIRYIPPITSITFSSSLVLSSMEQSIKFWWFDALSTDLVGADTEYTQSASPSIESVRSASSPIDSRKPASPPIESAGSASSSIKSKPAPPSIKSEQPGSLPIKSISLQAWDGIAITRDSTGVMRIWDTSTGDLKQSIDTPARALGWGDAELVGGTLTSAWFTGEEIHLWDTERGHIRTVDVPRCDRVWDFRVSVNGSKVFLMDCHYIRAWSIETGEVAGEVKLKSEPLFNSLVVSYSRVWARFKDSGIQGWDFGSNAPQPVLLSGLFSCPLQNPHLVFIDRTEVWNTDPSRIEDTDTGGDVFRLSGRYAKPTVARWDGRHLVAGYNSGEVLILNQETRKVMICNP